MLKEAETFNAISAGTLMEAGMDSSGLSSIKKEIEPYYNIGISITLHAKQDRNIPRTVVMENENASDLLIKVESKSSDK